MRRLTFLLTCIAAVLILRGTPSATSPSAPAARHTFTLSPDGFLLDGQPFQIMAGEIHPARVPDEYWQHRIRMAKAMGLNTIAAYVFWNHHERPDGTFDFSTGTRNLKRFVQLAQAEGLWVLLRPGPYVCAEWDFGGLPVSLLQDPGLRIRSMYPTYTKAVARYVQALAPVIRPMLVANGGPVLMVQIENEYGSYGNDRTYIEWLRTLWQQHGIPGPFYTADGPTPHMIEAGSLPGAAVGLDSGSEEGHWTLARRLVPGVPVFSSETYPGWLTHWGEPWARPSVDDLLTEVRFLLETQKSFNFYVIHGGTNFGFTAGANSGGKGYEPDVTSYDYDAPIDEQGRPTPKYHALRQLMGAARGGVSALPPLPEPIPTRAIDAITMRPLASIWDHLPAPHRAVHPLTFEAMGQNQGLVLYRTRLVGRKSGKLVIHDLHDFATVFVDGTFVGTIDRRLGENSLDLPQTSSPRPTLDILVEGMGHINFAHGMIDRKGITDHVTLAGMTLMNWDHLRLPLDNAFVETLWPARTPTQRQGLVFEGRFELDSPADTFFDLRGYRKGVVWVNGHNLGRYWDVGPQTRLYCPASWLKAGTNQIIVFDMLGLDPAPIVGFPTAQ